MRGVDDRGQRVIIDIDQRQCFEGGVFVTGGYRGDGIADEAHLVECDDRLIAKDSAIPAAVSGVRAEVVAAQHRAHAA